MAVPPVLDLPWYCSYDMRFHDAVNAVSGAVVLWMMAYHVPVDVSVATAIARIADEACWEETDRLVACMNAWSVVRAVAANPRPRHPICKLVDRIMMHSEVQNWLTEPAVPGDGEL